MATFMLVSGAWHGAWCWERLIPLLEAAGHRVIALELPGMGADRTPLDRIDLSGWGRFVAEAVRAEDEKIILVGHSRGGIVISQAANEVADRIAGLVYLTAMLLPDGESWLTLSEKIPPELLVSSPLTTTPDGVALIFDPAAIEPMLYHRTDRAGVERAQAAVTLEPVATLWSSVTFGQAAQSLPRAFIECSDDQALPIGLQRLMQEKLPCDPVVTLDSDHSPFFSAPAELADALDIISRGWKQ